MPTSPVAAPNPLTDLYNATGSAGNPASTLSGRSSKLESWKKSPPLAKYPITWEQSPARLASATETWKQGINSPSVGFSENCSV